MIRKLLISLVLLFSVTYANADSLSGSINISTGSGVQIIENILKEAKEATKTINLTVGTIERKPFSYIENNQWVGYSIDLWREVAERNNFEYTFNEYTDFSKMLSETQLHFNDLSVANISVTAEREKIFDYSNPIYDSGLNIMGLARNSSIISFYSDYVDILILGLKILLGVLLFIAHFYFVKNVMDGHLPFYSYFKEIVPILFEILIQIKDFLGTKIIGLATLIVTIFTIAYFSQLLTIQLNQGEEVNGGGKSTTYHELKDYKNGVTNGSTSMSFLESKGIPVKTYAQLNNMYSDLEKGEIDFIVNDDPVLKYHAKSSELQIYKVCGKLFNHDKYAIIFPQFKDKRNTILIEKINISLLEMKEDGSFDEIYDKYF